MPSLTCPRCGNRGDIRANGGAFEAAWPLARGHFPVRVCRECGAGIIVRPKFLVGVRSTLIPDDTWRRMEETFARSAAAAARTMDVTFVCEECGRGFESQTALEDHARDAHPA
jgi:predicted RNA-binding Zn-ribbon protein involved in translation (DUF1610 family)